MSLITIINVGFTQKWEKWNDKIATITCLAWGLGENYYYCYQWDANLHKSVNKKSHHRKVIKDVVGYYDNGQIIKQDGSLLISEKPLEINKTFSELDSPATPSNYVLNFKNWLHDLSKKRQEIRRHNTIPEVKESETTEENDKYEEIKQLKDVSIQASINFNNIVKEEKYDISQNKYCKNSHNKSLTIDNVKRNTKFKPKTQSHSRTISVDWQRESDYKYIKNSKKKSDGHCKWENKQTIEFSNNELSPIAQKSNKQLSLKPTIDFEDKENMNINFKINQEIERERK